MGWSAHYVAAGGKEGGREDATGGGKEGEQASCGETKITPLSELEHQSVYLAFLSACLPRFCARSAIERLNPDKSLLCGRCVLFLGLGYLFVNKGEGFTLLTLLISEGLRHC